MRLFFVGVGIATAGLIAFAQQPQQELAPPLRTAGPDTRAGALAAVGGIPQQEPQSDLVYALEAADGLRRDLEQRRLAILAGKPLAPSPDLGEYLFAVVNRLAQFHDPAVLGPLMAFINTGTRAMDAIADFGEEAVAEVLIVASARSDVADAGSAMLTLKRMLERVSVRHPLSADSKRRITGVANDGLRGSQTFGILFPAIQLAVATGDPVLIQRVKRLASDERAATELGIVDQRQIQALRALASKALAARGIDTGQK